MMYKMSYASNVLGCMRDLESQQEKAARSLTLWDLDFSPFNFEPNF